VAVAAAVAGRHIALFAAGLALGGAAAAPSAQDLAGRWTHRFTSGDITGARFPVEDEVLIVAVDRSHAIFAIQLNFFNGHECSIGGLATLEGRQLVYRDPENRGYDGSPCTLRIWRDGGRLRWDDGEGTCQAFCGARGGLRGGEMRWAARRPLTAAEQARIRRP
jgi:hypothetical protein